MLILFYFFAASGGAAAVGKFGRALLVLRIISLDIYFLCEIFYFFLFSGFRRFCAAWFVAGFAGSMVSGGADCRWRMHVIVGFSLIHILFFLASDRHGISELNCVNKLSFRLW